MSNEKRKPSFTYFKLKLRLLTEQFGTCSEASIWNKHVQEKAKKEIASAQKLAGKLSKSLAKYKGAELPDQKEVDELKGILLSYMQRTGIKHDLPETLEGLLELALKVKEEWEEMMAEGGSAPTVFMRDKTGHAIISTHMILGNLKENLSISVNNGDKSIAKSKVSVGEMGALDIKVVENFIKPTKNTVTLDEYSQGEVELTSPGTIVEGLNGIALWERPIKFNRKGKIETAISRSEFLPVGTEYECTLRVRTESPLCNLDVLKQLFDLGKNNGLGQWRGSGKKGSFAFQIKELEGYKDPSIPEGWF